MNKGCNTVVVSPHLVENTSRHIVMLPFHCFSFTFTNMKKVCDFATPPNLVTWSICLMRNRCDQVNNNYIYVFRSDLVKFTMLIFTTTFCPFRLIVAIGCLQVATLECNYSISEQASSSSHVFFLFLF
jgi:hypothetical protein